MAQIPGWEKSGKRKTMGPYGKQQYYVRTKKQCDWWTDRTSKYIRVPN